MTWRSISRARRDSQRGYTHANVIDLCELSLPELFQHLCAGDDLDAFLDHVWREDLNGDACGDVTTSSIIPTDAHGRACLVLQEPAVLCGAAPVEHFIRRAPIDVECSWSSGDGDACVPDRAIGELRGPLRDLLSAERIVLNFFGRLSGVATLTRQYVDAIRDTKSVICDTRKTTPGLRALEKYAARCGGGHLHRLGLHDAALYKDNHLAHLEPSQLKDELTNAIRIARADRELRFVEIEVDALEQLRAVLSIEPGLVDIVLLDNMSIDTLRKSVNLRNEIAPSIQLEASGGITLHTARAVAETGVDRISVGALTHAARSINFSMDLDG